MLDPLNEEGVPKPLSKDLKRVSRCQLPLAFQKALYITLFVPFALWHGKALFFGSVFQAPNHPAISSAEPGRRG